MATSRVKLITINNIAPGQTKIYYWNNATPSEAVWYIQAVPLTSSFTNTSLSEQSVDVEITRVWRRLNRKRGRIEFPYAYTYEHEIWYEIKNIGSKEVDIDVYASIIS